MINPQSTHGLQSTSSMPAANVCSLTAAMLNADHEEWLAALLSSMSVGLNQMAAASIEQSLAGYGFLRNALNMSQKDSGCRSGTCARRPLAWLTRQRLGGEAGGVRPTSPVEEENDIVHATRS